MFDKLHRSQPQGSTIIFVLLIMLVAMVITTTIAAVVLSNLRASTAYNEHAHAQYAMETGIERGLYFLQYARDLQTIGATASLDTISGFTGTLSNNASYTMSPTFLQDYAIVLDMGDSAQWDLYAESYSPEFHLVPITGLSSANITWTESPACVPSTSQVEISFSAWTEENWVDYTDPTNLVTHYVVMGGSYSLGLDSTHLYKIRVKALNCPVYEVQVTPMTSSGSASTTDYINLQATGDYGNSVPTSSVTLPWNAALNPYFEYVLFAEDAITK